MYRLPSIIALLGLAFAVAAQSPHGDQLKMDCAACHTPDGWEIPADSWHFEKVAKPRRSTTTGWIMGKDTLSFNHFNTEFPLEGRHATVDCRACHTSLVFSEVGSDCISCHADMHRQTVGTDCARCHTVENWLVNNITELHFENGFPLAGSHLLADCNDCHRSETFLAFERIGNECVNCHLPDFNATTTPNHGEAGFSTDCAQCHDINKFGWETETINHDFFPLTRGHEIEDCARCHTTGSYGNTSSECVSCHQPDYNASLNPNHLTAGLPTDCASCHTTDPGWMPAVFLQHDGDYFPIYSGSHQGEWMECVDCHANSSSFAEFTCITCHVNPETDHDHEGINGYVYDSPACLACHPNGSSDDGFDHSLTAFPLTGAHLTTDCVECHANGYAGTPTECAACHIQQFNQTSNPNHNSLGLTTDCASCHTTEPDWMPASFDVHNEYYALNGAHAMIANDCATCHNGDYNNTPNTCFGCHSADYNATASPDHSALMFSTDCQNCHTENAWEPATFDHDGQYFPIYSGSHNGEWDVCLDCHTNPQDYSVFSCTNCHVNPQTNNDHNGVNGYVYESGACLACHPTGDADGAFDHNLTAFPLTGAHLMAECLDCHSGGYAGTPTDCAACHTDQFNQTTNPNHNSLGLSTDCASCHTTEPDWMPATFDVHDQYYALNGAHVMIANDCATCHNGDYNNTPNTCFGCHSSDYNNTTSPDHSALMFSTDCQDCHSETAWEPATFDHDGQYFPIYSGAHNGEWDVCLDCHTNPQDYSVFSCTGCHTNPETTDQHNGINGFTYNSTACLACHPTGDAQNGFDHNLTAFPLTGAHLMAECLDCHSGGYSGTPTDCAACHTDQFNQTTNPDHNSLGLSMDCAACHTTEPNWMPATFDVHNDYYALNGAHALIANDCAACHNGDYNNTPNTCFGCHSTDYNQTTNPDHQASQFPTDCELCHSETAWVPSTFDHDDLYFPIYSGKHKEEWDECIECHTIAGDFTMFSCIDCHEHDNQNEVNNDHNGVSGYTYESTACYSCHPNGN